MIFDETRNYTKKNWLLMVVYSVAVMVLGLTIANALGVPNYFEALVSIANDGLSVDQTLDVDSYINPEPYQYFIQFLVGSLTSLLSAGLMFGVLKTYREKTRLRISTIIEQLKKKPFTIFLACLIISLLNFNLELIPLIGPIISLVFVMASYFALVVLQEHDELEPIDALKESFKITRGHKLNLLLIEFKYFVPILVAIVALLFLTLVLGIVGIVIGLAIIILVGLRTGPNLIAAAVIYYDKLVNGL